MRRYHCDTSSDSDGDGMVEGEFDQTKHELLCFGLGPKKFDPVDPDGFKTVRNAGVKPARTYTDRDIKLFSTIYRNYFLGLTGIQLRKFQLTQSTHKYVSMLEFARGRDRVLATLFERRPIIWDLHAGSGADSIAFLLDLDPREVVMCQRSVQDGSTDADGMKASLHDYQVMCNNMKDFLSAVPGINARLDIEGEPDAVPGGAGTRRVHVKCKHKLAESFIMSSAGKEVDIVHLDPSWDDDRDSGGGATRGAEMTPAELFHQLERLIWGPIKRMNIKVGCYVIKTRWNWLKVQQYMEAVNSEFTAMYSVRTQPFRPNVEKMRPEEHGGVRGVYHYMILTHKEYKTIELENSQMYWDIVRNSVPVWVKKSTCVGLIKPLYSNHAQFPDYTESAPRNPGEYIKIEPQGKHRGAKIKGPAKPGEHTSYDSQKFEPAVQPSEEPRADFDTDEEEDSSYATPNPYRMLPQEARLKAGSAACPRPR